MPVDRSQDRFGGRFQRGATDGDMAENYRRATTKLDKSLVKRNIKPYEKYGFDQDLDDLAGMSDARRFEMATKAVVAKYEAGKKGDSKGSNGGGSKSGGSKPSTKPKASVKPKPKTKQLKPKAGPAPRLPNWQPGPKPKLGNEPPKPKAQHKPPKQVQRLPPKPVAPHKPPVQTKPPVAKKPVTPPTTARPRRAL